MESYSAQEKGSVFGHSSREELRPASDRFVQNYRVPRSGEAIFAEWTEAFRIVPIRYEDRRESPIVKTLEDGETVFLEGIVQRVEEKKARSGRFVTNVHCLDREGAAFQCTYFRFPYYLRKDLRDGSRWIFHGKAKRFGSVWTIGQPALKAPIEMGGIVPIYRKMGKAGTAAIQKTIEDIHRFVPAREFDEAFPDWQHRLLSDLGLPAVRSAFRMLHRPVDLDEIDAARDTFRVLEAAALLQAIPEETPACCDRRVSRVQLCAKEQSAVLAALPFQLNESQEQVWKALQDGLSSGGALRGLLLGGVGSGKSVLAYLAALALARGGKTGRVALLIAPTTILAQQLYEGMERLAGPLGIPVTRIDSKKSWQVPDEGAIWVGTQGVLNVISRMDAWDGVGLAIFDEEHRFGRAVKSVPDWVHTLYMSATPIPGTLARLRFGTMQLFRLAGRPRNVDTVVLPRNEGGQALQAIRDVTDRGGKTMVIYGTIQKEALPDIDGSACILSPAWGTDRITPVTGKFTPKEALREAQMLSDGARKTLIRLDNKATIGEIRLTVKRESGLFAFPLYAYDKEMPNQVLVLEEKDLLCHKSGSSAQLLVQRGRNNQYPTLPLYRESEIREGKDLDSTLPMWEKHFPGKCAVLTGAMKNAEKVAALARFASGECPILISTTIVEVGVDIQGTDLMIIGNGEKLGIASLVQLRGRVGRHGNRGTCIVIGPEDSDALDRLETFAKEQDDEVLATMDFYERGFGDLQTQNQSGNLGALFRLPRDRKLFERILDWWNQHQAMEG